MDRKPEIEITEVLIGKYLSGEATPEEAVFIDNWISRSGENQRLFDEFSRIWNAARPRLPYSPRPPEEAWDSIHSNIKSSRHGSIFYKIAAAFLVLIAGYGLFNWRSQEAKPKLSSFLPAAGQPAPDTLPDNTLATLIQGTEVKIGNQFGKGTREISLSGNEAYFVVTQDSKNPFTIKVGAVRLTVLGTAFDVANDSTAITLAVAQGIVKMEKGNQVLIVRGGSTATYFKAPDSMILYKDSLDENRYSYATGTMKFDNMPLSSVAAVLEKTYNILVTFRNPALQNLKISTRFYDQPLEYVLKIISLSLNIRYRTEAQHVYFLDK